MVLRVYFKTGSSTVHDTLGSPADRILPKVSELGHVILAVFLLVAVRSLDWMPGELMAASMQVISCM